MFFTLVPSQYLIITYSAKVFDNFSIIILVRSDRYWSIFPRTFTTWSIFWTPFLNFSIFSALLSSSGSLNFENIIGEPTLGAEKVLSGAASVGTFIFGIFSLGVLSFGNFGMKPLGGAKDIGTRAFPSPSWSSSSLISRIFPSLIAFGIAFWIRLQNESKSVFPDAALDFGRKLSNSDS